MADPHLPPASALLESMGSSFAGTATGLKRVMSGFNRLAASRGREWAMPNRGAIVFEKAVAAVIDATKAGINPAAVVLGQRQWLEVVAGRRSDDRGGEVSFTTPVKLIGLFVLVSDKVAGPLVVDADVRDALERNGIVRRPTPFPAKG